MRAGQPIGDTRKRFMAVALDGQFRISAVAPLLKKLIQMRNDTNASDLGIGIVSMLGFSATSKALQVRPGIPCRSLPCAPPVAEHLATLLDLYGTIQSLYAAAAITASAAF